MSALKPYGPKYLDNVLTLLIDAECTSPTFATLYALHRLTDWRTGVTKTQVAHKTLAKQTGASWRTVQRCVIHMVKIGILKYETQGNNYDGGEANTYRFAIPGIGATPIPSEGRGVGSDRGAERDPIPSEGRGARQRRYDPLPREGTLNPPSSLTEEKRPAASRGGLRPIGTAIAVSDSAEPGTADNKQNANDAFWHRRFTTLMAQGVPSDRVFEILDREREEAAVAAAENEKGRENLRGAAS